MSKFLYMKIIGLLIVVSGFSYCLTSFYNFYDYLFGDLVIANANIYLMLCGLVIPLYIFIFGIYFYFYSDKFFAKINPFIFVTGIWMFGVGILRIFINNGIMQFLHFSFSYVSIILAISIIYGCLRYKY